MSTGKAALLVLIPVAVILLLVVLVVGVVLATLYFGSQQFKH